MGFAAGSTVYRDRRTSVDNPHNPARPKTGSWRDELDTITLDGYVASSTSTSRSTATRSEILTAKSLFLTDPNADVQPGDRIRAENYVGYVEARPEADTNPFTGWQPYVEIPLTQSEG